MVAPEDHRASMLAALKGQALRVPDLAALLYPDWHVERHDLESRVRSDLDNNFTERWYPHDDKRRKLEQGDFTQIAGYFCNGCPLEQFRTLAKLMYWVIESLQDPTLIIAEMRLIFSCWMMIDCGNLTEDEPGTRQCHKDAIAFLKHCLERDSSDCAQQPDTLRNDNMDSFQEIGEAMRRGLSEESLGRFAKSMYDYVDSICVVQKRRIAGFPSWEDYIENRLDTVGAYPYIMAIEYAYGLAIPSWIYECKEMKSIFRETSFAVLMINDIFSLKKEVIVNQVDSAIPLKMYHLHLNAQDALEEVIQDTLSSRQRFDTSEYRLLQSKGYQNMSSSAQEAINGLIGGCKNIVLGNLKWSLSSKRYESDEKSGGCAVTFYLR